jgi:hypothetical protein
MNMKLGKGVTSSARRYVCFYTDGVYFSPRLDHDTQRVLMIIASGALSFWRALREVYGEPREQRCLLLDIEPA